MRLDKILFTMLKEYTVYKSITQFIYKHTRELLRKFNFHQLLKLKPDNNFLLFCKTGQ